MRVRLSRAWGTPFERDLETHIVNELTRGGDGGGVIEDVQDNVTRVANALAQLCVVLVDTGRLPLSTVNDMIGSNYDMERIDG